MLYFQTLKAINCFCAPYHLSWSCNASYDDDDDDDDDAIQYNISFEKGSMAVSEDMNETCE